MPPYVLLTAGNSLHWMDWHALMPRMAGSFAPGGVLAIIETELGSTSWESSLRALIGAYQDFKPHNLTDELQKRRLSM